MISSLVPHVTHLHFTLNDFSVLRTRCWLIATGLTYFQGIRPTAALSRPIWSSTPQKQWVLQKNKKEKAIVQALFLAFIHIRFTRYHKTLKVATNFCMGAPYFVIFHVTSLPFDPMWCMKFNQSSSKVAALVATPLISVQTCWVGARAANVSLQSAASSLVINQCSFLIWWSVWSVQEFLNSSHSNHKFLCFCLHQT